MVIIFLNNLGMRTMIHIRFGFCGVAEMGKPSSLAFYHTNSGNSPCILMYMCGCFQLFITCECFNGCVGCSLVSVLMVVLGVHSGTFPCS
jgi:hypothetical protein